MGGGIKSPFAAPSAPVAPAGGAGPAPIPPAVPAPVPAPPAPAPLPPGSLVRKISRDRIRPSALQPRKEFPQESLAELADSIREQGIIQPLVVRVVGDFFELIAGERRWRAAGLAGLTEVPVIERVATDLEVLELALIENLQREDLNPMDRATALRRLSEEFGVSHQGLAERLGLDRSTVTNLLRLNELDAATAAHVRSGALSLGHAKVLLGVSDVARRRAVADAAASGGWSVRQLEGAVREEGGVPRGTSTPRARGSGTSAHLADLQRRLEDHLGTRVELRVGRRKGAGELRIHFHSLDGFDGLMQRIGFDNSKLTI